MAQGITGHTPGPWFVEIDVIDDGDINIFADDGPNGPVPGTPICSVDVRGDPEDRDCVPREVALANAALIAKAWMLPLLADALRGLLQLHEDHCAVGHASRPGDAEWQAHTLIAQLERRP